MSQAYSMISKLKEDINSLKNKIEALENQKDHFIYLDEFNVAFNLKKVKDIKKIEKEELINSFYNHKKNNKESYSLNKKFCINIIFFDNSKIQSCLFSSEKKRDTAFMNILKLINQDKTIYKLSKEVTISRI